jgi:hypothetical protein
MTDIREYLFPDQTWALLNHLAVAGEGGQPVYTWVDNANSRFWVMKGANGFPWDSFSWDATKLYQSITENGWTTPTTFKMFASSSWLGANGGIAWLPIQFNPGGINAPLVTADSTYRTYTSCGVFTTATLGGQVMTTVEGPYTLGEVIPNFGPAIPADTLVIVQRYFWGSTMEVNVYAQGFGLVQWQSWELVTGAYVLGPTSLFNTVMPGGVPVLSFPCGVPTI